MAYLSAYAYGTVDPEAEDIEYPSILVNTEGQNDPYEYLLTYAATVCRRKLEDEAIERGSYSPAEIYRVSIWVPAATKREAFSGYVTAYWYPDGMIGDTVTNQKWNPARIQKN